jgi:hypothetical protein
MKKILIPTLIFAGLAFGCCKNDEPFHAYFYTTELTPDGPLKLYIDNAEKGELPVFKTAPKCGDSLAGRCIHLLLKAGKHKFAAKDRNGKEVSSGKMKECDTRSSVSGGMGGQEVRDDGDCTFINLFSTMP